MNEKLVQNQEKLLSVYELNSYLKSHEEYRKFDYFAKTTTNFTKLSMLTDFIVDYFLFNNKRKVEEFKETYKSDKNNQLNAILQKYNEKSSKINKVKYFNDSVKISYLIDTTINQFRQHYLNLSTNQIVEDTNRKNKFENSINSTINDNFNLNNNNDKISEEIMSIKQAKKTIKENYQKDNYENRDFVGKGQNNDSIFDNFKNKRINLNRHKQSSFKFYNNEYTIKEDFNSKESKTYFFVEDELGYDPYNDEYLLNPDFKIYSEKVYLINEDINNVTNSVYNKNEDSYNKTDTITTETNLKKDKKYNTYNNASLKPYLKMSKLPKYSHFQLSKFYIENGSKLLMTKNLAFAKNHKNLRIQKIIDFIDIDTEIMYFKGKEISFNGDFRCFLSVNDDSILKIKGKDAKALSSIIVDVLQYIKTIEYLKKKVDEKNKILDKSKNYVNFVKNLIMGENFIVQ